MSSVYSGVAGTPVTPYNSKGEIDYETFAKQINFLIENGVRQIAAPMLIGESVNLTESERRELAKVLASAAGRRVPTFVNVSHASTDIAMQMAEHAVKAGNTGVVIMAPYHWRAGQRALIEHFTAVADAARGECMIVNDPKMTGVDIGSETLEKLIDRISKLVAIVDASGDMDIFTDICELVARKAKPIAVFSGNEMLLSTMPAGARGCFSMCSEVAPKLVQSLYQSCAIGVFGKVPPLQFKLRRLLKLLNHNAPANIKYAMELLDRPAGPTRRPVMPPSADEKKWVKSELTQLNIFDEEPSGWEFKRKPSRQSA